LSGGVWIEGNMGGGLKEVDDVRLGWGTGEGRKKIDGGKGQRRVQ